MVVESGRRGFFDRVWETFIEDPIEGAMERLKDKALAATPYILGGTFVLVAAVVIFRRIGR